MSPARRAISIHALREEGDGAPTLKPSLERNFNPRPPRGGRRFCLTFSYFSVAISIHALREEGDDPAYLLHEMQKIFQSTPSARRATLHDLLKSALDKFQSTPSARRATHITGNNTKHLIVFQSTPSARRATPHPKWTLLQEEISIHALREEGDKAKRK